MTYDEIIGVVAADLGLPRKIVDRTYRAYWRVVREHIESLPLKQDLTDEEFLQLRPNVNIPSIGKLYVTLEHYRGVKRSDQRHHENVLKKIARNKQKEEE